MPIRDKQVLKISIYFVLAIASLLILSVNGHAITYFDDLRERRIVYIVSYQDGLKYSAIDRRHTVSGIINKGEYARLTDLSGPTTIELNSILGYVYSMDDDFGSHTDDAILLARGRNGFVDTEFYIYNPIQAFSPHLIITSLEDGNVIIIDDITDNDDDKNIVLDKGRFHDEILDGASMLHITSAKPIFIYFGIIDDNNWEVIPSIGGTLVGKEFYIPTAEYVGIMPLADGKVTIRRVENGEVVYSSNTSAGKAIIKGVTGRRDMKMFHILSDTDLYIWTGEGDPGDPYDGSFIPSIPNSGNTQFFGFAKNHTIKVFAYEDSTDIIVSFVDTNESTTSAINRGGVFKSRILRNENFKVFSSKRVTVKVESEMPEELAYLMMSADVAINEPITNFGAISGKGIISGKVISQSNNMPLVGFRVTAYSTSTEKTVIKGSSVLADGTYEITGLPSGDYIVIASDPKNEYATEYFDDRFDMSQATKIKVAEGSRTDNVNFKLVLDIASISGAVTSENLPVPRIEVQVYSKYGQHLASTKTRSGGNYSFTELRSGEYKVYVNAADSEFVSEWFDDVDFIKGIEKAKLIKAVAGKDTSGINIDLSVGATISGKVLSDDGTPIPKANVRIWDIPTGKEWSVKTKFNGSYVISNVPTGSYRIYVEVPESDFISEFYDNAISDRDSKPVSVKVGEDTSGIDFKLLTAEQIGYITKWLAIGPFAPIASSTAEQFGYINDVYYDFLKDFGGEANITPSEDDIVEYGKEKLSWRIKQFKSYRCEIHEIFGDKRATAYVAVYLKFPKTEVTDLWLGSDDTLAVWVNGKSVWRWPGGDTPPDHSKIKIEVQSGWNLLLAKVGNLGGSWWISARFPNVKVQEYAYTKKISLGTVSMDMLSAIVPLKSGINLISLPLKPDIRYTARSFAEKLDATMVIEYSSETKNFLAFLPKLAITDGFEILGGRGYIVNLTRAKDVEFIGRPWTGKLAPSAMNDLKYDSNVWAFVIGGVVEGVKDIQRLKATVVNLRTGMIATDDVGSAGVGRFATAIVDMNQNKVVELEDTIEISVHDELGKLVSGPKKYTVTLDNLRDAVAIVKMRLGDIVPDRTMLLQNYPNPFNPETWIPYQLANSSEVSIRIYEISGRLVQILNIGQKDGGVYLTKDRAAYWDGKNDMGELVASGVYFYAIEAGDYKATRKMMIMK